MANEKSVTLLIDELIGLAEHAAVHEYLIETNLVESESEKQAMEKSINESHDRIGDLRHILENNKSFDVCKDCYSVLTRDYCTCDEQMITINSYNKTAKIPKGWLVKIIKDYGYRGLDEFLDEYDYDLGQVIINQAIDDRIEITYEKRPEIKKE